MKRRGADSLSRSGGSGAMLRLVSAAGAASFLGAESSGAGAINRVGVKSGSCFRAAERFDSPLNRGERSRSRSQRGGTMGRRDSIPISSSAEADPDDRFASGSAFVARSRADSVGAGAMNRGGAATFASGSAGGGAMERLAPLSEPGARSGRRLVCGSAELLCESRGRSGALPLLRSGRGEDVERRGSIGGAGIPLRKRSGAGAGGWPRRLRSGGVALSVARS